MAREIIPHELNDWSMLDKKDNCWNEIDAANPDMNFGIHQYKDSLWTSGFVGVGRIFDKKQRPIATKGKEHIVIISSQYGMDPWKMLEEVMADDEYDSYIEELEHNGKFLFKVFYDQPVIRLAQSRQNDGDLLYALSFVNSCYSLCKKGLKKSMFHQEENYTSKVRGKINVKKNIRENTCRGRSDRFFCKYIDFTEDNIENRIIKATLLKCKAILAKRFEENPEITRQTAYCLHTLRKVKGVKVRTSDFSNISASGLYMYYKPLLRQARCIYSQKYYSYAAENGHTMTKSVFTIPYMINMETLFEFYARTMLKKAIDGSQYMLESYSKKLFLQKGVSRIEDTEKRIHLMPYCIPDIIICDSRTQKPVAVLDAKYKPHERTARSDTHQLLSYVLLTGAGRCAFVFPGVTTEVKAMKSSGEAYLPLSADALRYYELILGNVPDTKEIEKIFL